MRRLGVRFGAYHIFVPALIKPAPAGLVTLLWALKNDGKDKPGFGDVVHALASGRTSVVIDPAFDKTFYKLAGYRILGRRAVRVDILERLADLIRPALNWKPGLGQRPDGAYDGQSFMVTPPMMSILGATADDMEEILKGLGYRAEPKPAAEVKARLEALDNAAREAAAAKLAAEAAAKAAGQGGGSRRKRTLPPKRRPRVRSRMRVEAAAAEAASGAEPRRRSRQRRLLRKTPAVEAAALADRGRESPLRRGSRRRSDRRRTRRPMPLTRRREQPKATEDRRRGRRGAIDQPTLQPATESGGPSPTPSSQPPWRKLPPAKPRQRPKSQSRSCCGGRAVSSSARAIASDNRNRPRNGAGRAHRRDLPSAAGQPRNGRAGQPIRAGASQRDGAGKPRFDRRSSSPSRRPKANSAATASRKASVRREGRPDWKGGRPDGKGGPQGGKPAFQPQAARGASGAFDPDFALRQARRVARPAARSRVGRWRRAASASTNGCSSRAW